VGAIATATRFAWAVVAGWLAVLAHGVPLALLALGL
jgi:hypothetical protein